MTLTTDVVDRARILLHSAAQRLQQARITPATIADFLPERKQWFLTKKARFTTLCVGWPLGVLLITPDGEMHTAGESTRAVPPGHPGHVSVDRERRREYTRLAFESGYPEGEVIYFNSPRIELVPGLTLPDHSAVAMRDGVLTVRWNRHLPAAQGIPFDSYVAERVTLRIEQGNTV